MFGAAEGTTGGGLYVNGHFGTTSKVEGFSESTLSFDPPAASIADGSVGFVVHDDDDIFVAVTESGSIVKYSRTHVRRMTQAVVNRRFADAGFHGRRRPDGSFLARIGRGSLVQRSSARGRMTAMDDRAVCRRRRPFSARSARSPTTRSGAIASIVPQEPLLGAAGAAGGDVLVIPAAVRALDDQLKSELTESEEVNALDRFTEQARHADDLDLGARPSHRRRAGWCR